MSTITVRKTKKAENLIVENQVAVAGTSLDAQLDVVEAASKVTVITGSTKPAAEVTASNATIAGRAGNAAVKQVAAGINSVVNSNNTITLSAVKVSGNVYGGALVLDAKGKIANRGDIGSAVVNGSTAINLNNVISVKSVFGGGAGYGAVSNGDVTINYNGGKVSTIYGGGDRAAVHGNVNINISAGTNGKVSKIYAGGKNSDVFGKATVTFSGNGGLYNNFSGTVYGTGQKGYITGGSELVFDDYSGEFKGSVQAFNTVTISGSSNVIFTKGQHKTMKGAQYVFVVEQGHTSPMLTWNKKVQYANITVKVATEDAVDVVLIQSKYFKKDADFSTDWITVTNDEGETLSKHAYELIYNSAYEWQVNAKGKGKWVKVRDHGTVSISYKGTNATFNGEEEERVVLSGADDKINVTGNLKGGLSTAGGDDFIALHEGAKVSGGIDAGSGDDTLHVQKNVELNGVVSMGEGNDKVYVEEAAKVTSNIELGAGANELTVQKDASVTGTVVLEDGSSNVIRVNGGAISSITGKAESNEIHLNGTITGGGIGYWTALKAVTTVTGGYQITLPDGTQAFVPGEYVSNENPNSIFVTGNLDLRNADSNDKVYVNQYAAVNSIYLGSGDDYLEIANGAFVGHSYVSFGNAVDGGQAITGTIDLGSGSNTLVLKGDVAAAITSDVNAVNTIVLAGSITIDSNKFLTGRTGNVLIVSDGVEAIFNYTTVGAFLDGDKLFKGVYLSQNAMLSVNGDKLIQNFVGAVRSEGSIYVLDAADDGFVNDYYTKRSNGVESSRLDAQNVIVRKGAKISGSEINAAEVRLEDGATLTGGTVNAAITIMKGALVDGATLKGKVTLDKGGEIAGNTVIDAENAAVYLAGIVSAGTKINANTVNINSLDALPSEITAETVKIIDNYVNETLVIDFKEELTLENAVIGNLLISGKQYGKESLGAGTVKGSLTISALSWIIVSNSDGNKEFADSYTVEIRGTLGGNAAFSNNTIYVSGLDPDKLEPSITGDITGSGKFIITGDVKTFFDYGQFTDGINGFTFDIEAKSLLTFDGVVSDEQKDQLINEKVNFLEDNAMFAIGKQAVIENWTGSFDFETDLKNQLLSDKVLKFTDLYVKKNGKVFGAIKGDDVNNELELGEGVKVNGSRKHYDYATIDMQSGDDALIMNSGVEVNGSINMGKGNDTIDMLGNVKINTAVNQDRVAVSMGEGNDTLNVEGSGNAIAGTLDLSAGENTVNIKADGDLAIQDLTTKDAAKTVLNIDGTLKVDAEALVFKAGTTEINIGENGKITDAEGNTVASISMQSAAANKLYNKGVLETDLEMSGNSNLIDNFNSFTATDVLDMNGDIEMNEGQGSELTDTIKYKSADENTIENHGAFTAEAGINMFGNANKIDSKDGKFTAGDVVMAGTKTVENDKRHEEERTTFTQADSNILINRDAENVMELGSLDMKGGSNSINVADDEEDGFAKGTISADAVTMESTGSNTVKGTLNVNGDLRMSGAEGENQTISGSNKNEIDGTVTADSITMFGATNTVKGQIEAGNGILMAGGQKVEDGKIVYDKATLNTIDLDMAGSVSAEYASIEMHGNSNVIKSNAAQVIVDRSDDNSEESGEIEDINAKISSKDGIVMEGGSNSLDFSVSAVAKGEYTTDKHDHAEITVGNVNLTVESDITMNGDSNKLNLGYTLDANGEANITAGSADITVTGDIVMEGAENTLDLAITLNSANQSKVEAGALKLAYTGNISMTGKDAVNTLTLGVIANDLPDVDSHDPTYSERNVESAEVSVTGDIVMGGENATNELTVGKNTTVTGSITMGAYDRDTATKENILTLDVESAAEITSIKLLAAKNTVEFKGEGTVGGNFSVQGGENKVTVGEKVTVEKDMIFTDLYDEDGDGVDNGDLLLANEKNDVTVNGKVAGIDSSATSADDNFKVYGTAGNITTGNSKVGDVVTVGKGVLGEDDVKTDAVAGTVTMGSGEKLSDGSNTLNVNASSYTDADDNTTEYSATVGEVKLYSKVGNTVAINGGTEKAAATGAITMVSEAENSLTAKNNAVIGGDVSMTSATGNTLSVTGKASENGEVPATPEEIDYNGTEAIQAQINGSVTMTSSNGSNTAELIDAALKEGISMTAEQKEATVADNTLTIAGSSYVNKVWNAEKSVHEDNTVQQLATVGGAVSMTAADNNTLNAELATIGGAVSMTAENGSNTIKGNGDDTASVITLPSLEMTAKVDNTAKFEDSAINGTVAMTATTGDNTLSLTRTNSGDVSMTSATGNTLSVTGKASENGEVPATPEEIDYNGTEAIQAKINGSVTMTSSDGSNTAELIDAALKEGISMTAEQKEDATVADNTLTIAGSSYVNKVWNAEKSEHVDNTVQQLATVGGAVSMTAADNNTLNAELATIGGAVKMTAENGSNTIQGNGDDTASVITLPSLEMTAKVDNTAKFEDSAINGTVAMTAETGDNTLTLTRTNSGKVTMKATAGGNTMSVYGKFEKADGEADVPSYTRYTVDGIDMTGTNNALNVGSTANLGIVSLGAVNMTAKDNNTMNVVAGPEFDYVKGVESIKIDATAQADSITMAGAQGTNALNVNQGTLKVGTIAMSNKDKDGNTGVDSANTVEIAKEALLVAEAVTMGSANVTPDVTETAAGKYDDVKKYDIVKNADGSETYVYVWKDGATSTTPGDRLFTKTNTLDVNGKITATTVTMIGETNTLTISGPATNDPNGHEKANDYDETIARGTFTDVSMSGKTNTIAVGNTEAYKSAFNAASVTMGDIVLTAKDGKEVKVLAKENAINVAADTFFNVDGDITMTATDKNTVAIGDYSNRLDSKTKSVWITAAGDATGDNYFNYEEVKNTIGGSIVASGAANTVKLGKNSVVNGGLDLTGDSNEVTLNAELKKTRWEVNEDGKAVMTVVKADGTSVKMTEDEFNAYRNELAAKAAKTAAETAWLAEYTAFLQNNDKFIVDAGAVVKGDIAFKLATKAYDTVPAGAPVNTLTLGKGTKVEGSVISTDTYTYVDAAETVTSGANDTIVMDENSVIAGSVDLGYGNDSVTMTNAEITGSVALGAGNDTVTMTNAAIGGSVALGAGNDSVTVNGNAIIGGIDFGASDGDFNWTERTGYDSLDISGVLTVNGNITYSGNLVVNGEVKFADGFGFVADGDNAQLYYQNVTVENGTIEDPVELLGNLTFKGTVSVKAAISAYDTADVEFPNYPAGNINALTLADGAAVTLSDVNLGLGDNTVELGADASLTLDGALNANAKLYKVVDGKNVYVNAAGQTDAELQAIYDAAKDAYPTQLSAWESARDAWLDDPANAGKTEDDYITETGNNKPDAPVRQEFVQGYRDGSIDMAMWNGSVLTVNKDVEVRSLNLKADAPAAETVFNYTIAGSAELTVTGSIGVEPGLNNVAANVTIDTAVTANDLRLTGYADTVALNAEFTAATLDMGAGDDVLNINAKFTAATLDMGVGNDVLNINAAGSDITTISNAETVNISADTTLKTVTGSTRIVVKSGTASITAEGGIVSYEVQGGTLNGALSRDIQVVENASLSGSSTGTITVAEGKSIALSNGYSAVAINGTVGGVAETVTGTNITVQEANNVSFDVTGTLTLTGTSYAAEFEVANATIKFNNSTVSFDSSAWTGAKYDFSAQTTAVTDTAAIADVADWGALFGKFSVDLNTTTNFYSNTSLSGITLNQLAGRADNTTEGSITLGTTTFTAAAGSDDFVNNGKKLALTGTTLGIASV